MKVNFYNFIKRAMAVRRRIKAKNVDRKIIKSHKDWIGLEADEKKVRKEDILGLTIYKNIYPFWNETNIKYFVTDELEDEYLLPYLNAINYNELGMRHKINIFQDKNYQPLLAKGMKFPESIIHNINGEWYDDEYKLISKKTQ